MAGRQSGVGDATQSLFFSPKALTAGGWTWGVGPVFLLPTATADLLGSERWGAGPTFVALRQTASGWTYGALTNCIASFAIAHGWIGRAAALPAAIRAILRE